MNFDNFSSDFFIEHFTDIIIVTDQRGIIQNNNPLASTFFSNNHLKGIKTKDVFQLIDNEGNELYCPVLDCIKKKAIVENSKPAFLTQLKKYVSFKAIPIINQDKAEGCLLIIKDIHNEIVISNELEQKEHNLELLFEGAPLGIAIIDIFGNIIEVNETMVKLLGSPSKEATKSINVLEFKPLQESPLVENINIVLKTRKKVTNTTKYITKWGKLIYVFYQLIPIIEKHKITRLLLYVNDLTPIYEAQEREQLVRNQISLLHQFSYEFNTLNNYFDPFVFIGEKVKVLFPDCTISIHKYHPAKHFFSTEYIYSPKKPINDLIEKYRSQNLKLSYTLKEKLWPKNFEGKLITLTREEFATVSFSLNQEEIIDAIAKSDVKHVYTMGFINNSMLLGNITLFTHQEEKNIEILEVFINQASLLLQRHLNQKLLSQNHRFYKSILNTIEDFIIVLNPSDNIIFANEHLLKFLYENKLPTSILGIHLSDGIPFINTQIIKSLNECKKTKKTQLIQTSCVLNNTFIHCQTSISEFTSEDIPNYIIAIRDVTKLIISEKEISNLTSINQKIIENLSEGILLVDSNNNIKLINKKFKEFFEINDESFVGKDFTNILPLDFKHRALEIIKDIHKNETSHNFEFNYKSADGKQHIFSKEIFPIIENHQLLFILIIFRDITDQKQREINLIESKEKAELSNKLKSTFIATISHEIRNPLNAINGFASLLLKPEVEKDKRDQFVKQINASSLILSRLIDDLIDLTKLETGNLTIINETFFINTLLKELHEQYSQELIIRNKSHLKLIWENALDDDIPLNADKMRLKQILSNLLINAIKYTYDGEISFGYKMYNNSIIFYVKDTGIGIKEEELPNIFKPFRQVEKNYLLEQKGAGLGLAVVKQLVELMKGTIHVDSKPKIGTTFSIRFSYEFYNLIDNKETTQPKQKKKTFNELTVLIAEDDDINFLFLEEMLSDYKIKIIHAKNGQEAVDLFKNNINSIDIILMDIQMPILDGFSATMLIKELKPEVPVIAQTAYAYSTEIDLSKKAGCSDYLVKPIQQELLIEKIATFTSTKK